MRARTDAIARFVAPAPIALVAAPVALVDGALDDDTCAALVARIEALGPAPTRVRGAFASRRDEGERNNTRVWLDDAALATRIWSALAPAVEVLLQRFPGVCSGAPVGCTATFRGYRYRAGERFAVHVDRAEELDDAHRTAFTALVYLTDARDGLAGGATRFPGVPARFDDARAALDGPGDAARDVEVVPVRGRCVVFAHLLPHEGCVVTAGTKYALRTNVIVRSP